MPGKDRRGSPKPDTLARRRREDKEELAKRAEEFRLFRDKVLLALGTVMLVGVGLASIFANVRNESLALAALTVAGGLLGAPTFLRIDERRTLRRNGDDR